MTIKGKGTNYLYVNSDGIYIIQLHIPVYMRHLWNGRKMLKKSTGTRDLVLARRFRDQYLMEFRRLQAQFNPNAYLLKIQSAITDLRFVGATSTNLVPDFQTATKGKPSTPKLKDLCDEYMKVYSDRRSYSTLQKSARAVEAFTKSIKRPAITIGGIGRRMVTEFLEANQGKFSPQTLQNWLTSLGSLYEFAKRRYDAIPDSNPFHGHNLEARRTIESYQPFEPEQLQTLVREADNVLRDVILIGLYSGMRLDEIASIKRAEIVMMEGVRCFFVSKSKTLAGVRYVPIHSLLIGIVDKHLANNSGEYLLEQSNKIIRKDGKRGPWYSQKFTRLRDSVLPTATDRQCFHSLRGMFITCLDRAGVPEQRIGAITGHTEQKAKTEAFRTYSKGAGMKELSEYVELVSYGNIE
ncbi:tyrosine-type recombinase/integrase [Pantoea sp. LS15]|uniref:tyrosine-type recombinase/integrase n=1 Tax=Enterobacterales TaxID=91347 RepID=UPI000E0E09E3|nr:MULTISPECIES: tyrosine-type recombinase/integrase [Enterobacterales]NJQ21979.1 tyrosine-type recombinase/integrase [Pantoea sp. LS15]NKF48575.1 tyrosine-type recombinase/integrase [Pantoea sp. LS15]RDK12797.1 integrase [Enterobacter sp. 9-2]